MSPRRLRDRIQDILDAIAEIDTFTRGMDVTAFREDAKTVRAVELNFIVIGEAATHIPADVQGDHPEVPWHLMRAMRNLLVHAYFSVDPQIVWETTRHDFPQLVDPLQELLAAIPVDPA